MDLVPESNKEFRMGLIMRSPMNPNVFTGNLKFQSGNIKC
jgi:hypothetical protein